ncbi:hypothetical protein [Kitasatospora purpeofusca]|uniref:hypothetical protein n=1 Tax=Kitasatospora purpeofusca TaxID=67352 RepID=UPI003F4ACFF2
MPLAWLPCPTWSMYGAGGGDVELGLPESKYAVRTAVKKGDVTVNVASGHSVTVRTRNGSIVVGKGGKSWTLS